MVEYEEASNYAEENSLLFMETSAKNANNVNEIFLEIARKLPRDNGAQGHFSIHCFFFDFFYKFLYTSLEPISPLQL